MHSSKAMSMTTRSVSFLAVVVLLLGSAMGQDPSAAPSLSFVPSATPSTPEPTPPATDPPSVSSVPTLAPSTMPSPVPVETTPPTTAPSVSSAPTPIPSPVPTVVDTTPSLTPSMSPSGVLSEPPTLAPSWAPSYMPSVEPSQGPSYSPSGAPSGEDPTASPSGTSSPTASPFTSSVSGLKMNLIGLSQEFDTDDDDLFASTTAVFIDSFHNDGRRRRLLRNLQALDVENVSTTISVTGTQVVEGTPSQLEVTYDQDTEYTSDSKVDDDALAQGPFLLPSSRLAYTNDLKEAGEAEGNDVFDDLVGTTAVQVPEDDDDDEVLSTGAIIGIAVGGGVGLLLLAGGFMYLRSRRSRSSAGGAGGYLKSDADDVPPGQLQLSGGRGDEVSTLGDPKTRTGVASGDSFTGYGDQSVATVDYDYSKAYGGAGESVSSAGGTFGSNTQGQASTAAGIGAGAAVAAGAAAYSDDESFDAQYRADRKEEVIDVYAPAGKLGVVIDTPDDGPPIVHAIKDSSVIADKLQVGDMLISVDEEDVRSMTAIKVSKLISRKSGNATRKLTVVRASVPE